MKIAMLVLASLLGDINTERKLSLEGVPAIEKKQYVKIVSFTLNSISKSEIIHQAKLDGNYIKFDLANYQIDPKVYDEFIKPHKNPKADWFIANAMVAPNYYKFLGLKTVEDYKKLTGLSDESVMAVGLILSSGVAMNSRLIMRYATPLGYSWEMRDVVKNNDFDFLNPNAKYDGRLMLGSLPNGLQVYFQADSKDNGLDHTDPVIMADHHFPSDRRVKTAQSCVVCHRQGVTSFQVGIFTGKVKISKDEKTQKHLNMFVSKIEKNIEKDQNTFRKAIDRVNGLTPEANAKLFLKICLDYEERIITHRRKENENRIGR